MLRGRRNRLGRRWRGGEGGGRIGVSCKREEGGRGVLMIIGRKKELLRNASLRCLRLRKLIDLLT